MPGKIGGSPPDPSKGLVGLDLFVDHLLDAAHARIQQLYPDFVQELQRTAQVSTPDDAMATMATPEGSSELFGGFSRLLTLVFDVELAIRQLSKSLALLGKAHDPYIAERLGMGPGEWYIYNYNVFVTSLWGVLDRLRVFLPLAARTLRRPYDPDGAESMVKPLLEAVMTLRRQVDDVRNPIAHSAHLGNGGYVTGIEEAGLWKHMAALRLWIDPMQTLDPLSVDRERDYGRARQGALAVITTTMNIMKRLVDEIDWDRVKLPESP